MSDARHGDDAAEPPGHGEHDADPCAYTEYREGEGPRDFPATGEGAEGAERAVWDALYDIEDPEMPVSVVDLGLIYGVEVTDCHATVEMTLTYTGCPARSMLTGEIERAARSPEGVEDATVRLVWSPEWTLEMVTEDGREALRGFGVSI